MAEREVQDEALTVYAHKLSKAEAQINWSEETAVEIDRHIRAFNPWPVAFIALDETNNSACLGFYAVKCRCFRQNSLAPF